MDQMTEDHRTIAWGPQYLTKLIKSSCFQGHARGSSWHSTVEINQKNYVYFSGRDKAECPNWWDDFPSKHCRFEDAWGTMPSIVRKEVPMLELVPGGHP